MLQLMYCSTLVSVAVFGATAIGLGFSTHSLGGVFNQVSLTMMAATVGPITGLFLLSAIFPKANAIVRKTPFPKTSNPIFVFFHKICFVLSNFNIKHKK